MLCIKLPLGLTVGDRPPPQGICTHTSTLQLTHFGHGIGPAHSLASPLYAQDWQSIHLPPSSTLAMKVNWGYQNTQILSVLTSHCSACPGPPGCVKHIYDYEYQVTILLSIVTQHYTQDAHVRLTWAS